MIVSKRRSQRSTNTDAKPQVRRRSARHNKAALARLDAARTHSAPARRPWQRLMGGAGRASSTAPMRYPGTALTIVPERRRFQPRVLLIACAVALLVTTLTVGGVAWARAPRIVEAQEVLFDGRSLGMAASAGAAQQTLTGIREDLKKSYGMEIALNQELELRAVRCDKQNLLSEAQLKDSLRHNIDVDVVAAVIEVNDRPAVALKDEALAQQALDELLTPFENAPDDRARDVGFVENVQIKRMPIDHALITDAEDAARTLRMGAGVDDNWYTVAKGDSLSRIAKKFNLRVSDLRKANPEVAANDVIQPGQTLNAVRPNRWVNIRFTDTVTRQEALPHKTVEQTSDELYTTQKEIKQQGKDGKREVVARVTYINGMESARDIVSERVTEEATDEIVLRGTKKVPTSGGGTTSGKFMVPVKNYRFTSSFRLRTLGGVTRWHNGVDLAASKGTPIYASRDGKVSFSGSNSGYGLLVKLDHGNDIETRYGHCSKLLVKKGQKVKKGDIIALVGSTGRSTGPHVHFEIRINGKAVNPEKHVNLR